jgi:hypothetical protein
LDRLILFIKLPDFVGFTARFQQKLPKSLFGTALILDLSLQYDFRGTGLAVFLVFQHVMKVILMLENESLHPLNIW